LWCGVISLLLSAISIVIIYSFSVDIAQAVNQIFSLVTTMGLIIGIIVVIRRYLQRMTYDSPAA
jgi:cell division protein FtsW (lipid II flippase)